MPSCFDCREIARNRARRNSRTQTKRSKNKTPIKINKNLKRHQKKGGGGGGRGGGRRHVFYVSKATGSDQMQQKFFTLRKNNFLSSCYKQITTWFLWGIWHKYPAALDISKFPKYHSLLLGSWYCGQFWKIIRGIYAVYTPWIPGNILIWIFFFLWCHGILFSNRSLLCFCNA